MKPAPMKNKKTAKTVKEFNFKTHKNDRNFGYAKQRAEKLSTRFEAWKD